jgi:hypothetical protein
VAGLRTENSRIDKELYDDEESEAVKRARPELLDDLPPPTAITHVARTHGRARVPVSGREARSAGANFAEWEITLEGVPAGPLLLKAHAEDASKNVEPLPHTVTVADYAGHGGPPVRRPVDPRSAARWDSQPPPVIPGPSPRPPPGPAGH